MWLRDPLSRPGALLPAQMLRAGSRLLPADVPVRIRRSVPFAGCSPGVSGTAVLSRLFVVWGVGFCLALSFFFFFSRCLSLSVPEEQDVPTHSARCSRYPGGRAHPTAPHRRWSRIPPGGCGSPSLALGAGSRDILPAGKEGKARRGRDGLAGAGTARSSRSRRRPPRRGVPGRGRGKRGGKWGSGRVK